MGAEIIQPGFAGGEVAETLYGRIDFPKERNGLALCRNFVVHPHGAVQNRAGTQFVGAAHNQGAAVRLIPFVFSSQQSYALEFGDHYMRVISYGGHVTEAEKTIIGITNANPAVAQVPAHGYSVGDEIYFGGVQGMVQINGRRLTVQSVIDADHFTLNIDTRGFGTFTADTGGSTNPPPAPASGSGTGPGSVGYYGSDPLPKSARPPGTVLP